MIQSNRQEIEETESKIKRITQLAQRTQETQKELQERLKGFAALRKQLAYYED
jgi:hypothetical protein